MTKFMNKFTIFLCFALIAFIGLGSNYAYASSWMDDNRVYNPYNTPSTYNNSGVYNGYNNSPLDNSFNNSSYNAYNPSNNFNNFDGSYNGYGYSYPTYSDSSYNGYNNSVNMDEQTSTSTGNPTSAPIYQESQEKNAKWLWLLIILIIIGALVFAFFRGIGPFAQFKKATEQTEASPTPEVLVSNPSPDASPQTEEIDRKVPQIRVLNGSGVAGVASSFKDFIEELGYKVVSIGNANNYDYTQTEVRFKDDFKNYEQTLVSDLSDNYSVTVGSSDLESSDSADIEIIVGSK